MKGRRDKEGSFIRTGSADRSQPPSSPLPDWFRPTVVECGPPSAAELTRDGSEDMETLVWEAGAKGLVEQQEDVELIGGKYRLLSALGHGGMARLYKVSHLQLGRELALKIIASELSSDPTIRQRFDREAHLASQLEHPNIVSITDFGIDEKHGAYIVMEYLRGETLLDLLLRETRLKAPIALDIALQTAEALHYMHQKDIVHCDVKADNVFLCRPPPDARKRRLIKLIDFGLSGKTIKDATLAKCEVGGTPRYVSPEQIRRLAPQPSMDIYSLGVLLFEMVTGQPPFSGDASELIEAHLNVSPPLPSEVSPEPVDELVEALILKALSKQPDARQASMGQMIFELRTLQDMLGGGTKRRGTSVIRKPALLDAEKVFLGCACPLFRLDSEGQLLAANPAFWSFVGVNEHAESASNRACSRLSVFFPQMKSSVLQATRKRQRLVIQNVAKLPKGDNKVVLAMMQLTPEATSAGDILSYVGIIHPMKAS